MFEKVQLFRNPAEEVAATADSVAFKNMFAIVHFDLYIYYGKILDLTECNNDQTFPYLVKYVKANAGSSVQRCRYVKGHRLCVGEVRP